LKFSSRTHLLPRVFTELLGDVTLQVRSLIPFLKSSPNGETRYDSRLHGPQLALCGKPEAISFTIF
jgi:hypothetical protein